MQEQESDTEQREGCAAGAQHKQKAATFAVHQHHAHGGQQEIDHGEDDIAPMGVEVVEAALK